MKSLFACRRESLTVFQGRPVVIQAPQLGGGSLSLALSKIQCLVFGSDVIPFYSGKHFLCYF